MKGLSVMSLPPLSIIWKAPLSVVEAYGLTIEAGTGMFPEASDPAAAFVTSAHTPYNLTEGGRTNIAAVDSALRETSLKHIENYIAGAKAVYPGLKKIIMHAAPKRWNEPRRDLPAKDGISDWNYLLESVRRLGDFAARYGLILCVENNRFYWDAAVGNPSPSAFDLDTFQTYYCSDPREWIRLGEQVDHPAVTLTLDSSHASTWSQRFETVPERRAELDVFRRAVEDGRVGHVHWNDSVIDTIAGREDMHLCVGEGGLGDAFHRVIKSRGMDGSVTLLLEHWYDEARLKRELDYIRSL